MKKLLFILALMFVITSIATGQVDRNLYLNSDATYGTLGLSSADTISNNDSLYIVKIAAKHNERATQSVKITLDSVSGSPYISAQLRGWLFENDTPTNIGSICFFLCFCKSMALSIPPKGNLASIIRVKTKA